MPFLFLQYASASNWFLAACTITSLGWSGPLGVVTVLQDEPSGLKNSPTGRWGGTNPLVPFFCPNPVTFLVIKVSSASPLPDLLSSQHPSIGPKQVSA